MMIPPYAFPLVLLLYLSISPLPLLSPWGEDAVINISVCVTGGAPSTSWRAELLMEFRGGRQRANRQGERGSLPGFFQSIPHYWLSISRGATHSHSHPTCLNLNEPEISLSGKGRKKKTDLWSRTKSEVLHLHFAQGGETFPVNMIRLQKQRY